MPKKTDLSDKFDGSSNPPEPLSQSIKPVARPVSKQRIDDLHRRLSRPRIAAEFTPMGATTRQIRSEADRKILNEIEAIRNRLELRRNALKEAFRRGHDNKTVRHGQRP